MKYLPMVSDCLQILRAMKYTILQKLKLCNISINQQIYPACAQEFINKLNVRRLIIMPEEVTRFLALPGAEKYRHTIYPHTKVLEYLASIKLLALAENEVLLDAAGGSTAEFPLLATKYLNHKIKCIVQDARTKSNELENAELDIEFVDGSVDELPLAKGSINVISCHHSFEHFRGNTDVNFIKESLRLLAPGGRIVIVPFFITNMYAEIWNKKPIAHYDSNAEQIYDRTASFPGWGPYEGFARTYDVQAFENRLLAQISSEYTVEIVEIYLDEKKCPDMRYTQYQPIANAEMKALYIRRN